MSYEAWRISYQDSEQAARAAFRECERLRKDAINSCGMLIHAAGGEITVTGYMQKQNYEIARELKMNGVTVWSARIIDQAIRELKE